MGCASSKLDDLEAVALCRERCTFLDEAIHQRYALAAAHMAYINSLKSIGHSLHLFIQQEHPFAATSPPSSSLSSPSPSHNPHPPPPSSSSKNHLPKQPHPRASPSHSHSLSNPDSHLVFDSDDEDEDDDDDLPSLHHSGLSTPLHLPTASYDNNYSDDQLSFPPPTGPGYLHMNYMKKKPASSLVYQQKPVNNDTVYVGESSSSPSSSSFNPYPYPSNPYPYDPYSTPYAGGPPGYYASPSFYGSSSSQRPPLAASSSSSSKPPPPPPSPPRTSAWDFLNFFDNSDDKYYPQYTPSRDSRDVREEEGIPDLEDVEYQHEVVKQVHGDQKLVDAMDGAAANHSKAPQDDQLNNAEPSLYQTRPRVSADNDGLEYDVHVVDKKVVDDDDGRSKERGGAAAFPGRAGSRDAFQVAKEIEAQFQIASDSGTEIAKILEVGKLPYNNRKHGAYQASSKMLHVSSPSMSMASSQTSSSTSKSAESTSTSTSTSTVVRAGPGNLDFEVDLAVRSRNLSSTLQKLYLWEKKLYNEVKAEEKMRLMHDKKIRKLKRLDERGADFQKVDSTRTLIRSLSTKIRMAIQVVDKISVTINKIRDEELWPQLRELIQGLTRMWKSMLECHRSQSQAIREARILGSVGSRKKRGDSHLLATKQLEQELINWTFQFSSWISAQKGYVRALNNWLMKCLSQEPEETPDGIVPFSPGRIGAPPIFVICNQWSQALDRIAEKEVVDSMHVFTMSVLQIWEQDKLEMHRQMMENKDLERIVKNIDRDDQKLQKQFQALERKIVLASGEGKGLSVSENIIYQSDKSSSLQASLQRIFEAMEKFTNESVRAYEELLQRNEEEEESTARDH